MRLFLAFLLTVSMIGCGKKEPEPEPQALPSVEEEVPATEPESEPAVVEEPSQIMEHQVIKGECLWYIAGYGQIYGDPYKWTDLYEANRDIIGDNPDLIYPGQIFQIP